jgi:hypothetical protein
MRYYSKIIPQLTDVFDCFSGWVWRTARRAVPYQVRERIVALGLRFFDIIGDFKRGKKQTS